MLAGGFVACRCIEVSCFVRPSLTSKLFCMFGFVGFFPPSFFCFSFFTFFCSMFMRRKRKRRGRERTSRINQNIVNHRKRSRYFNNVAPNHPTTAFCVDCARVQLSQQYQNKNGIKEETKAHTHPYTVRFFSLWLFCCLRAFRARHMLQNFGGHK